MIVNEFRTRRQQMRLKVYPHPKPCMQAILGDKIDNAQKLEKRMRDIPASACFALLFLLMLAFSSLQASSNADAEEPVFRAPFTLKLHIDKARYYEEHFDKIPYVDKNDVYLFAGENFGINVTLVNDQISRVTYQRDITKADVEFKFTQENSSDGPMMLLVTRNKLKHRLFFDALMTVPSRKEVYKTTVLPVESKLSNFESWPHPIVQLVLRNFRFSEKP
jgi:hypothetical protein